VDEIPRVNGPTRVRGAGVELATKTKEANIDSAQGARAKGEKVYRKRFLKVEPKI